MDSSNVNIIISERLENLMKEDNISVSELSIKLNIDESLLHSLLSNNITCGIEVICKIADYFEISTDYLLGRVKGRYESYNIKALTFH